ncbi:MAG: N-carbamoyl-L-amino acid hydrolase [Alphaproteobacteria bacterium MarineAlpha5_Bin9]|nr:MAG: N-carbamoyl-L-amino acid hydrolase [Alphaproteobacteria bacterium MarineAlpha5_Bin9]|tara:strand:+ start:445 stop:1662 length:1218 start_codon:yes stop_codon:yes gene_type:complete
MLINSKRFLRRIEKINNLKSNYKKAGINRIALTNEDKRARDIIINWMKSLKLTIKIDNIGNIFGLYNYNNKTKPILLGSHIDSVKNGGKYDGALGVVGALEVIQTLIEKNKIEESIGLAVFTNEEGVRFAPDMMGSWSFTKKENIKKIHKIKDINSITIKEALKKINYLGKEKQLFFRPKRFLELHIEQGPILHNNNKDIGIVKGVQAITWLKISLFGKSNHAGTTPLKNRHDPMMVFGKIHNYINSLSTKKNNQLITIGSVSVQPNQINVIANKIEFSVDMRNPKDDKLNVVEKKIKKEIKKLCLQKNIKFKIKKLVKFTSVKFDHKLNSIIKYHSEKLKYSNMDLFSGAGHDAQMLAKICPTSMIFVPSIKGISHDKREHTKYKNLIKGVNLLYSVTKNLLRN